MISHTVHFLKFQPLNASGLRVQVNVTLGALGIAQLRGLQARRNDLHHVGKGALSPRDYTARAARFLVWFTLPYLIQRVVTRAQRMQCCAQRSPVQ